MAKITGYQTTEARMEVKADIHGRWEQLNTMAVDISERASKQLFITNGAGAIALMSYFGIARTERIFFEMKLSLCFFVVGVFFAMIVTAISYHGIASMLEGWRQDTGKIHANQIDHEDMKVDDENRYKNSGEGAALVVSYLSFACFILGSLATMAAMICGRSAF